MSRYQVRRWSTALTSGSAILYIPGKIMAQVPGFPTFQPCHKPRTPSYDLGGTVLRSLLHSISLTRELSSRRAADASPRCSTTLQSYNVFQAPQKAQPVLLDNGGSTRNAEFEMLCFRSGCIILVNTCRSGPDFNERKLR